jgi:protein-disulfide isomerase
MKEEQQNPFAIIIVGTVMLCIGIAVGYFGRPMVAPAAVEQGAAPTPAVATAPPAASAPEQIVTVTPEPEAAEEAPESTPDLNESLAERQELMNQVVPDTRHFKGAADAPVTIIEFSDFQCPYCSRFAVEAGQKIDESYVEQGIVRFGYKHFVFLGEQSIWAAEASECAADQDAFWAYHDRLSERVAIEQQRDFTRENLKAIAADMGLDAVAFNACMESGKYAELVNNETQAAQQLGVRSTPTFLINGIPVTGAQPFDVFQRAIELVKDDALLTGEG